MQKHVSSFESVEDDDATSQGQGDLLDDFVLSATEVSAVPFLSAPSPMCQTFPNLCILIHPANSL